MSRSNCCFLTCIQVSQEASQVVWYSHLFQNFPQFITVYKHETTSNLVIKGWETGMLSLLEWWWRTRCRRRRRERCGFAPWVGKIPWRRAWQPTPVLLPGKFDGQRNLAGYSPRGRKELDMTERARTHTPRHIHVHTRAFAIAAQAWASPVFWVWGHLGLDIRGPLVHGGTETVGVLIVPEVTSKKLVSRAVLDPHRRDGPTSGADEAGERDRLRRRSGGGWKGKSCCLLMPPLSQVY